MSGSSSHYHHYHQQENHHHHRLEKGSRDHFLENQGNQGNQRSVKKIIDWSKKLQLDTSYINQGQEELCVAASFCLVLYWMCLLYNIQNMGNEISMSLDCSPCWENAYLEQRIHESQNSGRCKCDFTKNPVSCDNCGSTIPAACSVLQHQGFMSKNKKYRYTLDKNSDPLTTISIDPETLMQYLDQGPVICNMYIRKSQSKFLDSPSKDSYVFGNDKVKSYQGKDKEEDGVYDSVFAFPRTDMQEPREKFGHCVVIVGYNFNKTSGDIKFRVRNSFGRFWGHFGDFYLTKDHIHSQTIHQLVFIHPSQISILKI